MLVLARKTNQSIIIGNNIRVTVLGVEGEVVKLGIEAPREISIVRQELVESVRQENVRAAALDKKMVEELLGQGLTTQRLPEKKKADD
ncbi:carbon storage regulator CsrA [Calderihabitans maritimus]|uniref:Translational regulator CsrA n=1 Tax=Calderihabitans maritimus TaxID=1246530 RepID=A0A1Z5HTN6_9FIRM|nr:carbon storage regulator CsrA [Calderihabitans maritimus]GAW92906.1 carbon storage regulator [Calderihabitans maritimus]